MNLSERDKKVIWHPYTQMQLADPPVSIIKGEGVYLYDDNGNRYIDAVSSWWVNLHGHAHPYIAQKTAAQLNKLEHVIFAGFTHEPAVELAEQLLQLLPVNQSKIFYSDNGSTAVEVAVKMALQYWHNRGIPKTKIIAFEQSYHGDTFGAMSVSGRSSFTNPFAKLLFEVIHIPYPQQGKEQNTVEQLKQKLAAQKNNIAAFIFEPLVMGTAGMQMYTAAVLDELLVVCQENKVIAIADEVMTGFGRTGNYFAVNYTTHQPDIICLSKGITGGTMPLGVTTCTEEIFAAFLSDDKSKTFFHGHSYTANPVACSAALASLELLRQPACMLQIKMIHEQHQSFAGKHRDSVFFKNIRITGTIIAMDMVSKEDTSYFNSIRDRLYSFFLSKGVLLRPLGNTVYIMPPYCITPEELNYVYAVIEESQTILLQ
jgi:adenosylmethionine---8-amino-7-oxononanoate aminotransferase